MAANLDLASQLVRESAVLRLRGILVPKLLHRHDKQEYRLFRQVLHLLSEKERARDFLVRGQLLAKRRKLLGGQSVRLILVALCKGSSFLLRRDEHVAVLLGSFLVARQLV